MVKDELNITVGARIRTIREIWDIPENALVIFVTYRIVF